MLDKMRLLIDQVSNGDISKLEAIDVEFEKLVKDGTDAELQDAMVMMEQFLFAESHLTFEDGKKAA